jgi:phosphoribosylformylglycinamidine cyclo-ligase
MPEARQNKSRYAESGVNIAEGNAFVRDIGKLVHRTYGPEVVGGLGGFSGLFSLANGGKLFHRRYRDPLLTACTDGVGTKLKVAFAIGKHDTVGIDLVAMSVNDMIVQGAKPLFFLDYIATGRLERGVLVDVVKGITDGCVESGCALLGGETAELPGFYQDGEYDLAGFSVGIVDRPKIIDGSRTEVGDVLLGLSSSGMHSNGYSLARRVLIEEAGIALDAHVDDLGCSLGEELLCPTRIYARAVDRVLGAYKVKRVVKGMAHITGGGLTENVPRALPRGMGARIRKLCWPALPVFEMVRRLGKVEEAEMMQVFNMGIGLVMIVSPTFADAIVRRLDRAGFPAQAIGEVVNGSGVRYV